MPPLKPHDALMRARSWLLAWRDHWHTLVAWGVALFLLYTLAVNVFAGWKEAVHALMVWGGAPVFFGFTFLYNVLFVPFPYDPFLLAAPWLLPGHSVAFVWLMATTALTCAAGADFALGTVLAHKVHPWLAKQRGYARCETAIQTYGVWAVGLSAMTPIPFSLVCWMAGIAELSWVRVVGVTFLSRGIRCALVLWFLGS